MKFRKIYAWFIVSSVICLLIGYSMGIITTQYRVTNVASIKTIGVNVYKDQNCTEFMTVLDWGMLEPSSSKTFKVYVKSISNTFLTLNVFSANWQPTNCTDYMIFVAEPNNFTMQPLEMIEVNLTLTIAFDIHGITNFAFDIMFEGIG